MIVFAATSKFDCKKGDFSDFDRPWDSLPKI